MFLFHFSVYYFYFSVFVFLFKLYGIVILIIQKENLIKENAIFISFETHPKQLYIKFCLLKHYLPELTTTKKI